jgi:hypothetical protein
MAGQLARIRLSGRQLAINFFAGRRIAPLPIVRIGLRGNRRPMNVKNRKVKFKAIKYDLRRA